MLLERLLSSAIDSSMPLGPIQRLYLSIPVTKAITSFYASRSCNRSASARGMASFNHVLVRHLIIPNLADWDPNCINNTQGQYPRMLFYQHDVEKGSPSPERG